MIKLALSVLAPFWRPIVGAFAGLAAYFKGRADARTTAQLKDHRNAQRISELADQARAAADRRDRGDQLRDDDGHRRD